MGCGEGWIVLFFLVFGIGYVLLSLSIEKEKKEAEEKEKELLSKMSPEERSLYLARKELIEQARAIERAKEEAEWEREKRYSDAAAAYWRANDYPEGPYRDQAKAEAMARMIANGGK